MLHTLEYPASATISASLSTLTRIRQQYNMSTKRAATCKSSMMSVDDSVLVTAIAM